MTTAKINTIMLDTPFARPDFVPRGRSDFGGPNSVRQNLRRIGVQYMADDAPADCFGVYLGQHGDKWLVGIKDIWSWEIVKIEEYDSLGELKQCWELD
jgi:hypothetical protein